MLKAILILHRYTGVLMGVLMTLWCLSGFVMMYQSYPELSPQERLGGLEPLRLDPCCNVPRTGLADDAEVSDFRIEMLGGEPVLRLFPAEGRPAVFSLTTGEEKTAFSDEDLSHVAAIYGARRGIVGAPRFLGVIDQDQWTIQTARRNAPVHHFALADHARTEVYVSGKSGEVFQDTNGRERFWTWLGAIPHWLYPTILRQNGPLWSQVVIWTSTIGVFLTITGLYVGVTRLRKLPNGRWTPYRGLWFWHHMTGLVFGILTLTWVTSGLLTMNPWGLLEGAGGTVRSDIAGKTHWADVKRAIAAAPTLASGEAAQLTGVVLGGRPHILAVKADGARLRFDLEGVSAPLSQAEVARALARLPVATLGLQTREDSYYYAHHNTVTLPVYRAILADAQKTHVYIDAQTGRVLRTVDGDARATRWLSSALHDFDFPVLRKRPVWDLVVIPLLLGVTAVCALGAWLGFQRIGRDWATLRVMARRRRKRGAQALNPSSSPTRD